MSPYSIETYSDLLDVLMKYKIKRSRVDVFKESAGYKVAYSPFPNLEMTAEIFSRTPLGTHVALAKLSWWRCWIENHQFKGDKQ